VNPSRTSVVYLVSDPIFSAWCDF